MESAEQYAKDLGLTPMVVSYNGTGYVPGRIVPYLLNVQQQGIRWLLVMALDPDGLDAATAILSEGLDLHVKFVTSAPANKIFRASMGTSGAEFYSVTSFSAHFISHASVNLLRSLVLAATMLHIYSLECVVWDWPLVPAYTLLCSPAGSGPVGLVSNHLRPHIQDQRQLREGVQSFGWLHPNIHYCEWKRCSYGLVRIITHVLVEFFSRLMCWHPFIWPVESLTVPFVPCHRCPLLLHFCIRFLRT